MLVACIAVGVCCVVMFMLVGDGLMVGYCWRMFGICFGCALWFGLVVYLIGRVVFMVSDLLVLAYVVCSWFGLPMGRCVVAGIVGFV